MDGAVKLGRAKNVLRDLGAVAIAYSGGADSTLLLKIALDELSPSVLAIIVDGGVMPAQEVRTAAALARELGTEPVVLSVDLLSGPEFRNNHRDRCYTCKLAIMGAVIKAARERGFDNVVDGSHTEDTYEGRPGLRALRELRIRSPLSEAGMNKRDVRELSTFLSLPTAGKPASPCLATRIPFGQEVTSEKLVQIDAAEQAIRKRGIGVVRVRHHGDLARIEVPVSDIPTIVDNWESISSEIRMLGFRDVEIDPRGYRTGSLSEPREKQKE